MRYSHWLLRYSSYIYCASVMVCELELELKLKFEPTTQGVLEIALDSRLNVGSLEPSLFENAHPCARPSPR